MGRSRVDNVMDILRILLTAIGFFQLIARVASTTACDERSSDPLPTFRPPSFASLRSHQFWTTGLRFR